MPDLILPGVYIQERAEALIVSGPIASGNIGIVGTARQGPIGAVQVLGSYADATAAFGNYDAFDNPDPAATPPPAGTTTPALTLVRALKLAYDNGASTVFAVRVSARDTNGNPTAKKATFAVPGTNVTLNTKTAGYQPVQITVADTATPPTATSPMLVTFKLGQTEETFTVKDGTELLSQVNAGSTLVDATASGGAPGKPTAVPASPAKLFTGGDNGANAKDSDYKAGLDQLLNENVQIIVAAGLDDTVIGDELKAHVQSASTDKIKRDRIAIVGSRAKKANEDVSAFLGAITKPSVTGDRVVFVAPGITTTDEASGNPVTLPGAYAAAAIAGMLSARDPQVSLTNKTLAVAGVETRFTSAQLEQLVTAGVLALENRRGIRVVRGVTTDTGAFQQITTRRIVDNARAGVRSSADPFIGLLNNDRVRKALKGAINGFLANMVDDEKIVSYELDVTATRDQEIRGIAQVTMTVRPTFSIDYIKVVMFLT